MQFKGDDNGRMLLSLAYLSKRGWNSPDVILRAKRQLLDGNFIFETVKGHRPNKASWYAVTWRKLDNIKGFDPGVEKAFEQGAYRRDVAVPTPKMTASFAVNHASTDRVKNAVVITSPVAVPPSIGTSGEVGRCLPSTSDGAIATVLSGRPATSGVHPLEEPSAGVDIGAGVAVVGDIASRRLLHQRTTHPSLNIERTATR
jgi:hypothetical protein